MLKFCQIPTRALISLSRAADEPTFNVAHSATIVGRGRRLMAAQAESTSGEQHPNSRDLHDCKLWCVVTSARLTIPGG